VLGSGWQPVLAASIEEAMVGWNSCGCLSVLPLVKEMKE